MLTLSNGHKFSIACAAGALSFGRGYLWEKLCLIPLGIIKPKLFTVITPTITFQPRKGNMRLWPPCVLPLADGGAVNAKALTNCGLDWLINQAHKGLFPVPGLPTIVSVMAENVAEAQQFGHIISQWRDYLGRKELVGIEVNVSCSNVHHASMSKEEKIAHVCSIFRAVKGMATIPVGIKLGWLDPFREICDNLDGESDWFDLINTILWSKLFPDRPSPLARWGYEGSYSGPELSHYARHALHEVTYFHADDTPRTKSLQTPIISGGGIGYTRKKKYGYAHEAIRRLSHRASAVTIGTPFLTRPWRVNEIARQVIKWEQAREDEKHAC